MTQSGACAGLFQMFRFMDEKELAEGTLVEVLQAFGLRVQISAAGLAAT